jgi:hypothetical protein
LTEEGAAEGVHQAEAVHRPRHTHVTQATFLLHCLRVLHRAGVREESLVEADDEDDGELQAFGGVQGQ